MKKRLLTFIKFLVVFIVAVLAFDSVSTMTSAADSSITLGDATPLSDYISGTTFSIKYKSDGTYLYCVNMNKLTSKNVTANLVGEKSAGLAYIMENGTPYKSFTGDKNKDYYITQAAVWWYLDDTTGSSNLSEAFKTNAADPSGLRPYIIALKEAAKKVTSYSTPSISVTATSSTLTLSSDKSYYVSDPINVTSTDSYKVTIDSAPNGTIITDTNGTAQTEFAANAKFLVKVPTSSVTGTSANIKVTVTSNATVNKAYEYQPTNADMQNIALLVPTTITVSASTSLNIDTSKVRIIKVDKDTGNAIAGAKLVLKDADGKTITSWTSTINAHVIGNLSNGEYTITETEAPVGYLLNKTDTHFTISDTSKNVTVKIENKVRTSVVNITKIDDSTGAVLSGAVLVVKDADGNVIDRFTTTDSSHAITDLKDGTYTVSEESAPVGYIKSNDSISFTIDDDHLSHQIEFVNSKAVVVPNTASNASLFLTILGITVVGLGIGFVYKNGKKVK